MVSWLDTLLRERQSSLSSSTRCSTPDSAWGNQDTPVMTGIEQASRHFTPCEETPCSARAGGTWLSYKGTSLWACLKIKTSLKVCAVQIRGTVATSKLPQWPLRPWSFWSGNQTSPLRLGEFLTFYFRIMAMSSGLTCRTPFKHYLFMNTRHTTHFYLLRDSEYLYYLYRICTICTLWKIQSWENLKL